LLSNSLALIKIKPAKTHKLRIQFYCLREANLDEVV
jgi:hypothetical protein